MSGARIVNIDRRNQIGKRLRAEAILSFHMTQNAHVIALVIDGIHGIRKMIGSVLTGKGGIDMKSLSYGITMLIDIKEAALNAKIGTAEYDFITNITHCGTHVIANKIDGIIENLMKLSTNCAVHEHDEAFYRNIDKEWSDLGFIESPGDMSEEQKAELRAIAKSERFLQCLESR